MDPDVLLVIGGFGCAYLVRCAKFAADRRRIEALYPAQMGDLTETGQILSRVEAMPSRRPLWKDQSLTFPYAQ
jgi:hypothetical protein